MSNGFLLNSCWCWINLGIRSCGLDFGNFLKSFLSQTTKIIHQITPMNLNSIVSVTFFVLPNLKTLAASLPFFKIFSNRLSISDCRVFEYFLLTKKHTHIRQSRRYYIFLMQTSRMHLRNKILFSLLNYSKLHAVLEGVAFQMTKIWKNMRWKSIFSFFLCITYMF